MPMHAGSRIGPYEVTAQIGQGGMGEVYRARDTKLDRDVAIKVLPETFAHDGERLARFEREAKTLASLNHPNIAAIFGLEDADGVRALVLELVEGTTLAGRIAHGAIPLDEALPIARQIADALEAAHEHGIIHRDLKPANIKIRPDGTVKVLDFGLAKALGRDSAVVDPVNSPTLSIAATQAGVILGTAAYMAPEQAKGKPVDRRADIWAFGCVLYEMLTGRRAFDGDDVTDTLVAVLSRDPDFGALAPETPAAIRKLLQRCLARDPRKRLADAAAARLEIEDVLAAPGREPLVEQATPTVRTSRRTLALTAGASLLIGVAVAGSTVWLATRPDAPRVVRLTVTTSGADALLASGGYRDLAFSSDGTRLAYVGTRGRILVRALDQLQPTAIDGLGAPRNPFFSPDGQWIGYFDGTSALKKVAATGGPPVIIFQTFGQSGGANRGATWTDDDTIILATNNTASGLVEVPAGGGEIEILTTPDREKGEVDHLWPEMLPAGRGVLFTIASAGPMDNAHIAVLDLSTREQKVLIRGGSHAHYVPTGHLVYGVAGTLRAAAFDLDRLEVIGAPVPVLDGVVTTAFGGLGIGFSVDGTLVYVEGGAQAGARRLIWVDRHGAETPLAAPPRAYQYPRISPDGTRVAVDIRDQEQDVWIWDLARETLTRFTFDPALDLYPVWTPDGRRLVFASQQSGLNSVFWQAADGTGSAERLLENSNANLPHAFTPDGSGLIVREDAPGTGQDLALITLGGERHTKPLLASAFNELNAELSPDGRWLAYQSTESGQDEVYVRPFPDVNGGRWQVSGGGGRVPAWARSGREIFFLTPTGALMSVAVDAAGSTFRAGNAVKLFEGRYFSGSGSTGRTYDVSPDGERFLIVKTGGEPDVTSPGPNIMLVQNWFEELERLVPRN